MKDDSDPGFFLFFVWCVCVGVGEGGGEGEGRREVGGMARGG